MARQARSSQTAAVVLLTVIVFSHLIFSLIQAQTLQTEFCRTLVHPFGYDCQDYTVQTQDGFLLTVHNIHSHGGSNRTRHPVFLMHGLLAGADMWLIEAEQSLPFMLVEAGFDVWLGNNRCNRWSGGHTYLSPQDQGYWDWTWDQLAAYDLPAMLFFVRDRTGSSMSYVAHSQGVTILLAGLSSLGGAVERELTNILTSAALLCPIAYLGHTSSPIILAAADTFLDINVLALGISEFNIDSLLHRSCSNAHECGLAVIRLSGSPCCIDEDRVATLANAMETTSVENMAHFAQMIRTGRLQRYDYGTVLQNVIHYSAPYPPLYDLTRVPRNIPLFIGQGGHDTLATDTDLQHLLRDLAARDRESNEGREVQLLYLPEYSHVDFIASTNASHDVYTPLIAHLSTYAPHDT